MKRKSTIIIVLSVLLCSFTLFGFTAAALTEAGLQLQKYDLNGDGNITIGDVAALLDYLANNCGHQSTPIPGRAPTCTENGQEGGLYCPLCDAVLEEATPLFATGHSYNGNGVCENCGDELYSQGLEFEYDEELGGYVLTDYGDCTDGDLVIPPSYDGFPVVAIDSSAFTRCTDLVSVVIPSSVKTIGDSAFSRCTALEKVTIGSGVEKIGNSAFSKCTALTEISIPKNVETMGEEVFDGCTALSRIILDVEEIPALWHEDWKKGCDATVSMIYDNEWLEWLTTEDQGQSYTMLNWEVYLVMDNDYSEDLTPSGWEIWNSKFHLVVKDPNSSVDLWTDIGTDAYPYVWKTFYRLSDSEDDYKSVTGNPWSICPLSSVMLYRYNLMDYGMEAPQVGQSYHMIFCIFDTNGNFVCWSELTVEWTDSSEAYYKDAVRLGIVTPEPCEECQWQEATCETPKTCLRCYKTEGEALGHDWKEGVCSRCECTYFSEGLAYTLSNDKSYYTVTGIGDCTDSEIVIPATYKGKPVKAIGYRTFNNLPGLTGVTIPDSITSIARRAFDTCSGLTSIIIPDSVTSIGEWAFIYCSGLTDIWCEATAQPAGWDADWKYNCSATVHWGDSWEYTNGLPVCKHSWQEVTCETPKTCLNCGKTEGEALGHDWKEGVCSHCGCAYFSEGLAYTLSGDKSYYTVTGIGDCTDSEIIIPATYKGKPVTSIGYRAFYDRSDMTSIMIPNSVTSIGDSAFYGCSGLTSVVIPDSVTSIGYGAFEGCSGLTSIIIPDSVTSIEDYVFANCPGLTDIWCEATDKPIGWYTTWNSDCAATVHWGGSWEYVDGTPACIHAWQDGACSRCGCDYYSEGLVYTLSDDKSFYTVTGIGDCTDTALIIPAEYCGKPVKAIGAQAFNNCAFIESVSIPDSVKTIGSYAFSRCSALANITLGKGVTSIQDWAFYSCKNLKSVVVPDGVTSMGIGAFGYCSALTDIWCEAESKPTDWNSSWNYSCSATVHWCDNWQYVNGVPTLK